MACRVWFDPDDRAQGGRGGDFSPPQPARCDTRISGGGTRRDQPFKALLILVAFRHGLRAVEIADLEWSQVEWGRNPALHVRRAKNGKPAVHPIRGDELRMLRELQRNTTGAFVFETERGGPFTADAVNRLVKT